MHVGIIGGGMMGLATAYYLVQSGARVTLFEKEDQVGGLSRSEEIMPGLRWDRFYHVILSSDQELLNFLDQLGLSPEVKFRETKTGFFTDGKLHSMSNIFEFLKFEPLSFWSKMRLGAGILYASKINDFSRLEKMYAKTWLLRVFGRRNYEKLWDPLLRSKLGAAKSDASGSFIWSTIKRYYGTRHDSAKKELMGCVRGGYYSILNTIRDKLVEAGVNIHLNHQIDGLKASTGDKIMILCNGRNTAEVDRLVATVPNAQLIGLWPEMPGELKHRLQQVGYLSLVCATLVLRRSLCPFYVTNITDTGFPFTGLIEASNVIPPEVLNDRALVYLPRYMPPNDPFYQKSDSDILESFISALRKIFSDLTDEDIIAARVNKEAFVQPIQTINYSKNIPSMQTPLKNFYMVNTTMILNSTLNNNEVIKLAKRAAELVANDN